VRTGDAGGTGKKLRALADRLEPALGTLDEVEEEAQITVDNLPRRSHE
jgi:hypothetical protein